MAGLALPLGLAGALWRGALLGEGTRLALPLGLTGTLRVLGAGRVDWVVHHDLRCGDNFHTILSEVGSPPIPNPTPCVPVPMPSAALMVIVDEVAGGDRRAYFAYFSRAVESPLMTAAKTSWLASSSHSITL